MDWAQIFSTALEQLIAPVVLVYGLAAIGLNVQFGYTGLLNFGQAAFLAVGAYGVAVTVTEIGLSLWVGLLVGLVAAAVLALLLGIPTLRLRADYLAIVTIAAAEIVRLVLRSITFRDIFGGADGITAFAGDFFDLNPYSSPLRIGPLSFSPQDAWVMTVGWVLVALCCLLVWALMRSPWGRVVRAIREDEDAVRSLGKNVYSYKMQALILGGVIGALGGFVFALANASVNPDAYATDLTFFAYTILLLGGAARVLGPVVGSMIFWFLLGFLDNVLENATRIGAIPSWLLTTNQTSQVRYMLVGLALMALMIFRPQGIFGDRREVALDAR